MNLRMRHSTSGFFFLIVFLLTAGCHKHMSPTEVQTMQAMNSGWRNDIRALEAVVDEASMSFRAYHDALTDTANYAAKLALNDSLFMSNAQKTTERFESWFGGGVACVKSLALRIEQNEHWLTHLDPAHAPQDVTRRSWDSRRIQFYNAFDQCRNIMDEYPAYQAEMEGLKRRVGAK